VVAALGGSNTEDLYSTSYYGIFDGHNGALAAELAASNLHVFLSQATSWSPPGGSGGSGSGRSKGLDLEEIKRAHMEAYSKVRRR